MSRRGEFQRASPEGPIEKEHREVSLACSADGLCSLVLSTVCHIAGSVSVRAPPKCSDFCGKIDDQVDLIIYLGSCEHRSGQAEMSIVNLVVLAMHTTTS